jgi:hypothetical protein
MNESYKLVGQAAWDFIRNCVETKTTHRLQDFEYSMALYAGDRERQAIHLDWAIARSYDNKGNRIRSGELPIEICLTMQPRIKNNYCPPWFIWSCDTHLSKYLTMTPLLDFII